MYFKYPKVLFFATSIASKLTIIVEKGDKEKTHNYRLGSFDVTGSY